MASALPNLKSLSLASVVPTHADEGGKDKDPYKYADYKYPLFIPPQPGDPLPPPPQTWANFAQRRAAMAKWMLQRRENGEITQAEYDKEIAALEKEARDEALEEGAIAQDAEEFARRAEANYGPALRAQRKRDKELRDYVDGVGERDRDKLRRREEEERNNAKKTAAPRERAGPNKSELSKDELELQLYEQSMRDNGPPPDEHKHEDNAPMFHEGQPEGQLEYADDEEDEEDEEEDDDETQSPDHNSEETQVGVGLPESPKAPAPPPSMD